MYEKTNTETYKTNTNFRLFAKVLTTSKNKVTINNIILNNM